MRVAAQVSMLQRMSLLAVKSAIAPGLAQYIEAGKSLDADERLEAAHQLLLSVDRDTETDQSVIDAAWDEVVDRRVEQIVNGAAPLVDGPVAHARVRAEIAANGK